MPARGPLTPRSDQAISLTPAQPIAMLYNAAASAALERKRGNIKAISETYRSMTAETTVLFEPEKFKELAESRSAALAAPKPETPAITEAEFDSPAAAKIAGEPKTRERSKTVYLTTWDRYQALLVAVVRNEKVSAADLEFMAEFEPTMNEAQDRYRAQIISMNKI
jgi:hypothetical protein